MTMLKKYGWQEIKPALFEVEVLPSFSTQNLKQKLRMQTVTVDTERNSRLKLTDLIKSIYSKNTTYISVRSDTCNFKVKSVWTVFYSSLRFHVPSSPSESVFFHSVDTVQASIIFMLILVFIVILIHF